MEVVAGPCLFRSTVQFSKSGSEIVSPYSIVRRSRTCDVASLAEGVVGDIAVARTLIRCMRMMKMSYGGIISYQQ